MGHSPTAAAGASESTLADAGALVVVTGTATSVGKTWVSSRMLEVLRSHGVRVAARKPLQSFSAGELTDGEVLAAASGEDPAAVCPPAWSYPLAMAPPMAADALGRALPALDEVLAWLAGSLQPALPAPALLRPPPAIPSRPGAQRPNDQRGVTLVETLGGVRSPLCRGADSADLARALSPDLVLLVADAGLGAVNAVRLSAAGLGWSPVLGWSPGGCRPDAAPGASPEHEHVVPPLVVHLNRFDAGDDLHLRNRAFLAGERYRLTTSVSELAVLVLQAARPDPGTGGQS